MSLMKVAIDEYFWDKWEDKFMGNFNDYITPSEPAVKAAIRNAGVCSKCDREQKVTDVWEYVYESVDYELTKEWKTPKETLDSGTGDCEDVCFLAASMLIQSEVSGFDFVIGEMNGTGDKEKHTWLDVDGRIVDPTNGVGENENMEYTPEKRFTIKVNHD